jgi:hypothetical protein
MIAIIASALLVFRGLVCYRMLNAMPSILNEVAPNIASKYQSGYSQLPFGIHPDGPFSYGLFRTMTGVGQRLEVARPELVLEVKDAGSGVWHELQFLYKPGDVSRRPPIVAPYQPRLDWQMWFQALYWDRGISSEWFQSLIDRILDASPPVLALLDTSTLPDADIKALRIKFYSYNFTQFGEGGTWWHRIPRKEASRPKHYTLTESVNLAKEAQKASSMFHQVIIVGFLLLAIVLCSAPCFLGPAFAGLKQRMLQCVRAGVKEG